MDCEVFDSFNGTHNNTVAHFSFGETNNFGYVAKEFDEKYSKTNITFNKTDTNDQHFKLNMRENINFLQVQNHLLYTINEKSNRTTLNIND